MGILTDVKAGLSSLRRKSNAPGQRIIRSVEGNSSKTLTNAVTATKAYRNVPIMNRVANMLIDSAAQCKYDVEKFATRNNYISYGSGMQMESLSKLLNVRPNPYMDVDTFRRLVITDLIFNGCAYIRFDPESKSLYPLPAALMTVVASETEYVDHFVLSGTVKIPVDQIIFIKDNAIFNGFTSQISGQSRAQSALDSLSKREQMLGFKEKYLNNGTVIGLILETEDILNKKQRERKEEELQLNYNPQTGNASVLILDAGMKAKPYSQISSFKDLDFGADIARQEKDVCIALGVPYILIDGGNNANIRPNIELLYYMTIIPMLTKVASALSFFFGYNITPSLDGVKALKLDMDNEAKRVTSLVNNGIITGNEARLELGMEKLEDEQMETIRIPANIAGSATGVSGQEGGRPAGQTDNDEEEKSNV